MKKITYYLILLSVFLIPFYFFRFSFLGIKTNIFEVAVLFSAISMLVYLCISKIKPKMGSLFPYLFLLAAMVGVFLSDDKTRALGIFKGWFLVPMVLYWVVINAFDEKSLKKLFLPLYISFTIVGFWGLLQSMKVIGLTFYQVGNVDLSKYLVQGNFRIFGPFESPNYLAMYLVPMFFLTIPIFKSLKKLPKFLYLISLLPFLIAIYDIVMTSSRAGIIAFVAGFAILLLPKLWHETKTKILKYLLIVVVSSAILIGGVLAAKTFTDRGGSDASRVDIYKYSIQLVRDNPIMGIGLGTFQDKVAVKSQSDADFQKNTLSSALHPHNILLAVWLNLGLLGLLSFFLIVFDFYLKRPKPLHIHLTLLAAMSVILVHGLFDTTYFKNDLSAIFWLIIAVQFIHRQSDQNSFKN